ncbi:MAG: NPCBM/NEW2 domain-containing protein [Pirellulaceae bacterium]|nr:NPCBM/NEW2 domain-containing protein [Pirellulaceae bacterium]
MFVRMVNWRNLVSGLPRILLFLAVASASTRCLAQETVSPEIPLEASKIDGTAIRVPLNGVLAEGLRPDNSSVVSWDEINELKTANRLLGDDATATVVQLRGNGVLQVRSLTAAEGMVTMTTDLAEITYPLLEIQSIRFANRDGQAEWQALLQERSTEEDRILVTTSRGPRVIAGLLDGMDAEAVQIEFEGEKRRVTWDKILGIVPAALDKSDEPKFSVQLVDRSVLIADSIQIENDLWQIGWKNQRFSLSLEMVVWVRVRSNRVFYLSDLKPVVDEVQTIIAPPAAQRRDANVFGQPITLQLPASDGASDSAAYVQTFAKGWGTRSRGRLVFELPAGFDRLRGWVGIDSSANGQGICQATILVDGIQVFSQEVQGRQLAVALDVPIGGGRQLELLVEPGPQLDLSDWVNWADVRLLK